MEHLNFVEQLLEKGFVREITDLEKRKGRYDINFNTKNGWMGVVIYHPYEKFQKEDKIVELSLERFNVTDMIVYSDGTKQEKKVSDRQIICSVNGEVIYKNNFGVIPPTEVKEKLLN